MKQRAVLIFALLIVTLLLPLVVNRFIVNVLSLAFALAILATSIDLAGGYSGLVPLGQAGIMACSGYSLGYAATRLGVGYLGQILFGLFIATVVAALFGLMVMRTSGIQFLMVTLAQGMIVWGLSIRMNHITGGENGIRGINRPPWFDGDFSFFYFSLGLLVLGYSTEFVKFYSFVLAGALAGLAGVLFAYYNRLIVPDSAGFAMSGKGVLMVLLGGIGTLIGPVLGAVIVTFIENFLSGYVARWPTILGLIFILAVLFARQGIIRLLESTTVRVTRTLIQPVKKLIQKVYKYRGLSNQNHP
ncbi:MAG: branched-chain amino acid ABC transporter permease [Anaerolineales bacterium]